jgi:hypothetical protein
MVKNGKYIEELEPQTEMTDISDGIKDLREDLTEAI